MIYSYRISGMTCKGCTQIVHDSILKVAGVRKVNVELSKAQARVEMEYYIPITTMQAALADSLNQISELASVSTDKHNIIRPDEVSESNKQLITSYLTAVDRLDHNKLHQYLHPDFKYNGEVSYYSAHEYIEMIKDHASTTVADVLLKYDIKAIRNIKLSCGNAQPQWSGRRYRRTPPVLRGCCH